jgi:zinc protease
MTRDDLVSHYRRYYAPDNAAVVIAGDIDPDDARARVAKAFGSLRPSGVVRGPRADEPAQEAGRRVVVERPGQVGYVKIAHHAPAFAHPDFAPMVVADAILAGARGLNLWCSYKAVSAQRRSRLYRALIDRALASAVQGALMPTRDAFLHYISMTAAEGVPLEGVEAAAVEALDEFAAKGATDDEVARAKRQLHARMVFEGDSVTNIAHQAGYFHTIGALDAFDALPHAIAAVTAGDVHRVARAYLRPQSRTVGYFRPAPGA